MAATLRLPPITAGALFEAWLGSLEQVEHVAAPMPRDLSAFVGQDHGSRLVSSGLPQQSQTGSRVFMPLSSASRVHAAGVLAVVAKG
jgi:hypothetical protein